MSLTFKVAKTLYTKIEDYDVKKPKSASPKSSSRENRAGIPEDLIPTEILTKEALLAAINDPVIRGATNYYNTAKKYLNSNNYHITLGKVYNKYWYAFWFNPNEEKFVFHYSICFRNLATFRNYRNGDFLKHNDLDISEFTCKKHNKKEYLYLFKSVTPEQLKNRECGDLNFLQFSYNDNSEFRKDLAIKLAKYIKVWKTSNDPFAAWKTSLANCMGHYFPIGTPKKEIFNWVPDINFLLNAPNVSKNLSPVLETPFFKKEINKYISSIIEEYNKMENHTRFSTVEIKNKIWALDTAHSLYKEEMSLDLYQQLWNITVDTRYHIASVPNSENFVNWIRKNIPVKSFVNMMCKSPQEFKDALHMISDITQRNPDLQYDGRWRSKELHDHMMSEQWKVKNKNTALPQDLFPVPMKIDNITYIQPVDTHMLSKWGQAVRNCVANSMYVNGIKKKTHFIILGLKDHVPYLTVQARLENEVFRVVQIRKICNASLNHEEELEFNKTFSKAMEIRTKELAKQNES
jgi:hypothetical protein